VVAQESAKRKGRADGSANPKNRDREKEKFKF
jgi:hypothetical protein